MSIFFGSQRFSQNIVARGPDMPAPSQMNVLDFLDNLLLRAFSALLLLQEMTSGALEPARTMTMIASEPRCCLSCLRHIKNG